MEKKRHLWKPGQKGGSPAPRKAYAISALIRERVNPNYLIDWAVAVMQGHPPPPHPDAPDDGGSTLVQNPTPAMQQYAHQWLSDRGWGKPIGEDEIPDAGTKRLNIDYSKLSDEELADVDKLAQKISRFKKGQ